jgi:tRNA modification GTPase
MSSRSRKSSGDIVTALFTVAGGSAVATIGVAGPAVAAFLQPYFAHAGGLPLARIALQRIAFGSWRSHPADPTQVGEEVVVARRDEDIVEIHCHGGIAASAAILAGIEQAGVRRIDWRCWLRRFATDPLEAEARIALAEAATERTAAALLDQLRGALRRALENAAAQIEAGCQELARRQIQVLLSRGQTGLHLTHPWRVVLSGPPNVGKSSLLNALLGYERSIVLDQPGTTRDVVTALTALDGWPIEFSDTAGLRHSDDPLEALGADLARQRAAAADLVIQVTDLDHLPVDAKTPDARECTRNPPVLRVLNKADLLTAAAAVPRDWLLTSAWTGQGIPELAAAVVRALVPEPPAAGEAIPFRPQHLIALEAAAASLAAGDDRRALGRLADLLRGRNGHED